MLKFRTMRVGADQERAALDGRNEMDGPVFKMRDDPRVTRLGRILRRTSLDELPQLFNVLAGQMSIVGPRPLPVDETRALTGRHRRRLSIRPGLTCLWQVSGRNDLTFAEWMALDLEYVDRWTLWLDVAILLRPSRRSCRAGARASPAHSRFVASSPRQSSAVPTSAQSRRRRPRSPRASTSSPPPAANRTCAESSRHACAPSRPPSAVHTARSPQRTKRYATLPPPRRQRDMRGIKTARRRRRQLQLPFGVAHTWGGARKGAGRKPRGRPSMPHGTRPKVDPDIRCRSPSARRPVCRRFARRGCSGRSGAPSRGRRSRGSG
jgi:hypothetical protein